jgi:Ni,Fe-hydrogenase I small subunit
MTQDGLVADRTEVGQAVAAVGEHDRQIADHAAAVVAAGLCSAASSRESARKRPALSATWASIALTGVTDQSTHRGAGCIQLTALTTPSCSALVRALA